MELIISNSCDVNTIPGNSVSLLLLSRRKRLLSLKSYSDLVSFSCSFFSFVNVSKLTLPCLELVWLHRKFFSLTFLLDGNDCCYWSHTPNCYHIPFVTFVNVQSYLYHACNWYHCTFSASYYVTWCGICCGFPVTHCRDKNHRRRPNQQNILVVRF